MPAAAQYFSGNKVEYTDFEFKILATEHFDIYYYSREERAARTAARLAERWYARLSRVLNHEFETRQPLVLYGSQAEFTQTKVVAGMLPDSIGGVTESARRRIVMPFAPTLAETDRVLGHELVHAFQFDIARQHGRDNGLPLWFIEGMAEYLSRGTLTPATSMWTRDAVLSARIPDRVGDAESQMSPYLFGHAFWSYLGVRFGDHIVEKALKPARGGRRLEDRMRHATGRELDALYDGWRKSAQEAFGDAHEGRTRYRAWTKRHMQIGPALSPDGRHAVFFSEKDQLSFDLFLGDAVTGTVIRKLATTAASVEFDSLQPLRSAGAWSADGQWFAFAAVRNGRAVLQLIDMTGRGADRELVFPAIGQVLSPTWSPDGKRIAFSAITGGATDLYVVDVVSSAVQQLTDDVFADLQPAWSNDGQTIAFVSERFASDEETLRVGAPRLGLLDVATRTTRPLEHGVGNTQLNPQWSADDRRLYFISDPDGVANVYRLDLTSGAIDRITNVATAVSGITPTGPALSVSRDEAALAFTMYVSGRTRLVMFDRAKLTASASPFTKPQRAVPMNTAAFGLVDEAIADYATGLANGDDPVERAYQPRMALEGLGQPYLSSGGGPFGTVVRGGGALWFGDMLGERKLGASVQVGNRLRDAVFELRFVNQERRWTRGAFAEIEPGLARFRTASTIQRDADGSLVRRTDYFQRMQARAAAFVAYPFSRGLRAELFAGVRHAQYRRERRNSTWLRGSGRVPASEQVVTFAGAPTTVAETGAALVRDTSVSGPNGPLLGSRYRVELAPAIGELSYTSVTADLRHYLMPVRPFTIAMRIMHSGRYGADGNDPRLVPNFLASSAYVRGHGDDVQYCPPDGQVLCGDELFGNRMLVGNLEARFPLLGLLSRQIEYGTVPIDAFIFADSGVIASRRRAGTMISSIGGGVRMHARGLPIEIAAVRALDGPRPRWQLDLGFRAGF
jgi:Tol biopolymer transport system component